MSEIGWSSDIHTLIDSSSKKVISQISLCYRGLRSTLDKRYNHIALRLPSFIIQNTGNVSRIYFEKVASIPVATKNVFGRSDVVGG